MRPSPYIKTGACFSLGAHTGMALNGKNRHLRLPIKLVKLFTSNMYPFNRGH